ncbi:hypothetical protein PC122_g17570 [Phytophthora cactorum]|nr:hypothetical protein PC122_g17570 [Phytophthora cactorum]
MPEFNCVVKEFRSYLKSSLMHVKRKAKLSRVAVLSECRGKRYGTVIMDAVEDFIRDRVDLFILAALIEKKGFYEKCGYRCIDNEIFVDEGAKQCWMTKRANPQSET